MVLLGDEAQVEARFGWIWDSANLDTIGSDVVLDAPNRTPRWHGTCRILFRSLWRLALSPNEPKRASIWACHLGVPFGASKMISGAMVQLVQIMHLSCTETNTISEQIETSFHFSLVTQEYHLVHLKLFMSLWYVWRISCTYHAPELTLFPKGSKWDYTWPASPRSSIGCVQNDFWSYGTFGANRAPFLNQD
jgi:hypothetical protein